MKILLESIVEWEKLHPAKADTDGWAWSDVHGNPITLNSLVTKRILNVVFKSNKYCSYHTIDSVSVEKALADYQGSFVQLEEATPEQIPTDLFHLVIGHSEKKDIIMRSLEAPRPVSLLLWGTVASAKTLFLEDLGRLPHNSFILGSNLTKAGMFDILFNERPKYLIIDEIDKIDDSEVFAALLSLMHKGYITETKYRRHRTHRLKTWVFASANDISHLPRELLSRFFPLKFRDYTDDEFREVVVSILKEQEDIPESLGIYIAQKVLTELNSRDARDPIKLSRLLKQKTKEDVDLILSIMKKQR